MLRSSLVLLAAAWVAGAQPAPLAERLLGAREAERTVLLAAAGPDELRAAGAELARAGAARLNAGRPDEAAGLGDLLALVARQAGSEELRFDAEFLRARAHFRRSGFEAARQAAARSRELAEALDDAGRLADALRLLGDVEGAKGGSGALDLYRQSLDQARRAGDAGRESFALRQIGWTLVQLGEHTAARESYEQALAAAQRSGDARQVGLSESLLGLQAVGLGRFDEGEQRLARAAELLGQAGDEHGRMAQAINLANLRFRRGDLLAAQAGYREALAFYEAAGNQQIAALVHGNLGSTLARLGRLEEALAQHEQARARQAALGLEADAAATQANIAALHFRRGDLEAALQGHLAALAVAERQGNRGATGVRQYNLAGVYAAQGRPDLARDLYTRAIATLEAVSEPEFLAEAYVELGDLELGEGHGEKAAALGRRGLELGERVGLARARSQAHALLGRVAEQRGQLEQARQELQAARQIDEAAGAHLRVAEQDLALARLQLRSGQRAEAARAATAVAATAEAQSARLLQLEALVLAGRCRQGLGEREPARALFEAAARVVEELRERAAGDAADRQRAFEAQVAPYLGLYELAAEEGDVARAVGAAEQARARVLVEALREGRVPLALAPDERARESALKDALASAEAGLEAEAEREAPDPDRLARLRAARDGARRAREAERVALLARHPELRLRAGQMPAPDLAQLSEAAGEKTLLVQYTLTGSGAWAVALAGGPRPVTRLVRLAPGPGALGRSAERLRELVARRDLRWAAAAAELSRSLLAPFEDLLRGRRSVVVVPDGALWGVPFQALPLATGEPLLERLAVSYAPSLTAWTEMRRLRERRGAPPDTLLAVGAPAGAPADAALAQSRELLQRLGALYGPDRGHVLLGAEAQEDAFVRAARGRGVLQLATHGLLDAASPLYSSLLLAPGAGGDGRLEAREVLDLRLDADLAVLSACETARGRAGAGEGLVGLAWAFFVAGVPRVVVSQWSVEAASTTTLMLAFHRARLRGPPAGVAEALRAAALALRRDPRYRHPFYWAAFSVVGDEG